MYVGVVYRNAAVGAVLAAAANATFDGVCIPHDKCGTGQPGLHASEESNWLGAAVLDGPNLIGSRWNPNGV